MKFPCLLFIFLCSFASLDAQIQIGSNILGEGLFNTFGSGVAVSADGTIIAASEPLYDGAFVNTGLVKVFQYDEGDWIQMGQDFHGLTMNHQIGYKLSLSADGSILAVSQGSSGDVIIYQFNGSSWIQIGQDINEPYTGNYVRSISLSPDGTIIAIGNHGLTQARVRVFQYDGVDWIQKGQRLDNISSSDGFGNSVSLNSDGSILAVGIPSLNITGGGGKGMTKVYQFDGSSWVQMGPDIFAQTSNEQVGTSVSLSANGLIVASGSGYSDLNGTRSGQVKVNIFDGNNWDQLGQIITGDYNDLLGNSVSLSSDGSILAIGAHQDDDSGYDAGQTRLYQYNGFSWVQFGRDINGESEGENLGSTVIVSPDGSKVVVSSPYYKESGTIGRVSAYALKGVTGNIFLDLDQNCTRDIDEIGLPKKLATIQPGNIVIETDDRGNWLVESLPIGNYTISTDTANLWASTCATSQNFSVLNTDSLTMAPPIGLISKYPCASPDITINMPFLRPCFSDQRIYVEVCNTNNATAILNNPQVIVSLDSLITPTSFELNHNPLGNNQYQFYLSPLLPGQCFDFWIDATLDCAAQLGQGLCLQADLTPIEACVLDNIPNPFPPNVDTCSTAWDNSSLSVIGYCQNDSVYFEISNTGDFIGADMTCFSPLSLYVDGLLILEDSVQLLGQETLVLSYPANGESWHLEVEQHPLHPGNSHPRATVENCGSFSGQTKVNLFAMDDADPITDIYCGTVTGSFDPNDKTGFPLGLTEEQHIYPNQQIQYRIRFQNTGTDTAFTVVIRDTLTPDFNIYSLRPQVASHDYEFRIYGQRILEWTFNNIMLPDSNVNEAASHGFALFTVDQVLDLPDATEISNSAAIYFDFNEPIITNTTLHTVHYDRPTISFLTLLHQSQPISCMGDADAEVAANIYGGTPPYSYLWNNSKTTSSISGLSPGIYSLTTTDALGLIASEQILINDPPLLLATITNTDNILSTTVTNASYQWLDCNNNFAPIPNATEQSFEPTSSGSYAVEITQNNCTKISDCETIVFSGIAESFGANFQIFPNPTTGKINIEFGRVHDEVNVSVWNVLGQNVFAETTKNKPFTSFDLAQEPGVYLLKIINSKGDFIATKVLLN